MRRVFLLFLVVLLPNLPSCVGDTSCSDGPGIANTLATVDRWVRVIAIGDVPGDEGTSEVEMETASVDERGDGSPRSEAIVIHSDFVDGLKSALHAEEEVYVALARVTGEEMTSYVVVRDAEGEHHLPGIGCDRESFLRTQLGERYDSTMDMIIGMTSDRRIHEALAAGGIT